jgi:hypothetical protein
MRMKRKINWRIESMANNVLGFIGIENFEIILYLSRILSKLERKVLLIDYSNDRDLASCIPIPTGMAAEDDVITHFGIDFTRKGLDQDQELINEYDDILINFGFNCVTAEKYCTRLIFTVNQMLHNIIRLATLTADSAGSADRSLMIKDVVDSKISPEYIMECMKIDISKDNICVLYFDEIDMKYKILSQHNALFQFRKITKGTKDYLLETVRKLCPDVPEKVLKEAYKMAERGR